MPQLKPAHRLIEFQPLLDLANAKLTARNYRALASPDYPLDREDGAALFDRSMTLGGERVTLASVGQLQRSVTSVLRLELGGWDRHRDCDLSSPIAVPSAGTVVHRSLPGLRPKRRVACKPAHIIETSKEFVVHGRRPLAGVNLQLSIFRRKLDGGTKWLLEESDDSWDLQDRWYRMTCQLIAALREPTLQQSHLDLGTRYPLRPLALCDNSKCQRFFFRNTKRQLACSRGCKDRPYRQRKRKNR